jgi:hypothetical protein
LLGFLVAGVVGMRGGFPWGRITAMAALVPLVLFVVSLAFPEFGGLGILIVAVFAVPAGLLGSVHVLLAACAARRTVRG